jgi:hypothetical protein
VFPPKRVQGASSRENQEKEKSPRQRVGEANHDRPGMVDGAQGGR